MFLISGVVAGAGVAAIIRGSLTVVISTARPDDRAGALATFFTAGYLGVSVPVIGAGLVLQHLSPRVTLLVFALAVGAGILAATPILIRPAAGTAQHPRPDDHPMTAQCRCFGAHIGDSPGEPSLGKPPQRKLLADASRTSGGDDAS